MPKALSKPLNVKTYSALRQQVQLTLLDGQIRIEATKVRIYWETGSFIQQHILANNARAEYGAQVVARLGKDLDIDPSLLHRCLAFYRIYKTLPILDGRPKLTWTHYRKLIAVPDDKARRSLEVSAQKNAWTTDELAARIKAVYQDAADPFAPKIKSAQQLTAAAPKPESLAEPLVPLRGQLYSYQVFKRKVLASGQGELVLDLGFANYRDVEPLSSFSMGDIVSSVVKGQNFCLGKDGRTVKDLYTYQACVERVVDGDTLKVHIDLGFGIWTRQTLRLRGIDCPELGTKAGEQAKAFCQSLLKAADMIILRSSRSDKWDRYLADVFLPSKDGRDDVYLNNLMMEQGHAQRWTAV